MKSIDNKEIIIASDYFLEQLSLKTIINIIGPKYNLQEVCTYNGLENAIKSTKNKQKFVILTDSFIREKYSIEKIIKICKKCKLLYICDKIPENNDLIKYFILSTCSSDEIYGKFNSFFNLREDNCKIIDAEKSLLSDREIEVLKEVASGFSNKEIAEKLYISVNTVISHRKNITDKLDIKSISGLTVYALMHDLINPNEVKI